MSLKPCTCGDPLCPSKNQTEPPLSVAAWICPKCNGQMLMTGSQEWCGKNLKCSCCGEFSYYKDYTIKD